MASVTARINQIKQPTGGYIKPSQFKAIQLEDDFFLYEKENIHGSVVGMAVDYLTRWIKSGDLLESFKISLMGAQMAEQCGKKGSIETAKKLILDIKDLEKQSIVNACKLVTFDVWFRNPLNAMMAKDYSQTNPDADTVQNIQVLVLRSVEFFKKYGPVIQDGFGFVPKDGNEKDYAKMIKTRKGSYGGYTATVESGDGDFLTADTLWDFKVSKRKPTNQHTLQLLMYWIMGQHSGQDVFKDITKLGIFNPRLNTVYLLEIKDIPDEVIKTVEKDVICY